MGRKIWLTTLVTVFVLSCAIVILGVTSCSVAYSLLSEDTSISPPSSNHPVPSHAAVQHRDAPARPHRS